MLELLVLLASAPGAAQAPVLRIASGATFPPFHSIAASGEPTGFEIELARLVAEREELRKEFGVERDEDWPVKIRP